MAGHMKDLILVGAAVWTAGDALYEVERSHQR